MKHLILMAVCLALPLCASAELVAREVIRAGDVLSEHNTAPGEAGGGDLAPDLIGLAVRRTVYAGQKIDPRNTQAPDLVKRNAVVTLKYQRGGLEIETTGRALSDAGPGGAVKVLNLQSRQMISGIVQTEGWVLVQ